MDMPDPAYGEQSEFRAMQAGAPMMQEPSMPRPEHGMFDPSARPDEPVTSGIGSGPGAGPEPGMDPASIQQKDIQAVSQYLPALRKAMNNPTAPDGFKAFVRYLETFQ
ncbi:MAG: hypothetical protein ACYCZR_07755 [Burkholderiales bacterium]